MQKAREQLDAWQDRFKHLAGQKRHATLCLCPHRPCPYAASGVRAQEGDNNVLHCPCYRVVKGSSIEHRLLLESESMQCDDWSRREAETRKLTGTRKAPEVDEGKGERSTPTKGRPPKKGKK